MNILGTSKTQTSPVICSGDYRHLLCKKKHRKMVWSTRVVAWDLANIIMPARSGLSISLTPSECRRITNSKAIATIGNRNTPFSLRHKCN